jgi:hypothetical protein
MDLGAELAAVASAAGAHGPVSAVLAAEPAGSQRLYRVALGEDDARAWLVVDGAGAPVLDRGRVREVASIVVMCELAEELAGGGDLQELRRRLAQLRMAEQPPGIDRAEEAALALERAVGAPPRVAAPAYLDAVGAAALALERSLGDVESPFASALRASTGTVDAFVADVETRYRLPLS